MNILEALEDRGIEYKNRPKENEIMIWCPFCEDNGLEHTDEFKLGVNVADGRMHCFRCEANPSVDDLAEKLELGECEAAQELRKKKKGKKEKLVTALPEDFEVLNPSDKGDYWTRQAYKYIHRRNVTDRQIREKQIGYSLVGDYKYRIIIPVYYKKKLEGFVGRDFTGRQKPKYKNSIGDRSIYNVPQHKGKAAVLVEGVFDALAVERGVGSFGIDGLAVFGHTLTDRQLEMLEGYPEFILWPDPDEAGIKGFLGMVSQLKKLGSVHFVMPQAEEDYDPSDMSPVEVQKRIKKAVEYTPELELRLKNLMAFAE